jgi:hypothetical protein
MPITSFAEALQLYDQLEIINTSSQITSLKETIRSSTATESNKKSALLPINDTFLKYSELNHFLGNYIKRNTRTNEELSASEERYSNKIHPEESVAARESTMGLFPELRMRSIPYLLAISVFMSCFTIFLVFQMFGFSGQINLPLSFTEWLNSPGSPYPFYENPMILGGVIIILLVAVVVFAMLYFKSKKDN